jgi:hypothetical protein
MDHQATRRPPAQPNAPGRHAPQGGGAGLCAVDPPGRRVGLLPPAGSVEKHLVGEHGIPSVDLHWKVERYYSHEGDHRKQQGVRSGAVGNLLAVTHAHEQAA